MGSQETVGGERERERRGGALSLGRVVRGMGLSPERGGRCYEPTRFRGP
jgi:hypothetical protein